MLVADQLFGRWIRRLRIGFAQTVSAQQEDLGVLHRPIRNGGGDCRVVENVPPIGEGRVGGDHGGTFLTMAGGDDLIEEIGGLLIQRKVTKFVHDEQRGFGIQPELADQRMIHLRRQQVIEHVHGGGEQHALIGLTGAPTDDFRQEGFAGARIADDDDASAFGRKSRSSIRRMRFFNSMRLLWCLKWKLSMECCACSRDNRKRRAMER